MLGERTTFGRGKRKDVATAHRGASKEVGTRGRSNCPSIIGYWDRAMAGGERKGSEIMCGSTKEEAVVPKG